MAAHVALIDCPLLTTFTSNPDAGRSEPTCMVSQVLLNMADLLL
jgi:hypothetical protein